MLLPPKRGFALSEFETRLEKAQSQMHLQKLDAILLTTEPDIRYFTGFLTQFFESPTRPWFVILPLNGKPIAVIPEIGEAGMATTWVEQIYTWPAPRPDDDGISLLQKVIRSLPGKYGRLGVPQGHESNLRMPLQDYQILINGLSTFEIADVSMLLHRLRYVKSQSEIEKIHYICDLASVAFEALPGSLKIGESERHLKHFRVL